MPVHPRAEVGFGRAADAYERARPDYPAEAVDWLCDRLALRPGRTVVDLAAGTGKLTRLLVASGARVIAVEPVAGMRNALARAVPAVEILDGTAEAMPLPDGSADAITVAQAFHWFSTADALSEIHRVLAPGGALALVWNRRDLDDPLAVALDEMVGRHRGTFRPIAVDGGSRSSRRPTFSDRWRNTLSLTTRSSAGVGSSTGLCRPA